MLRRPARGAQRIKKKQGKRRWLGAVGTVETVETVVLVLLHLLRPRLFRHPRRAVTATATVAVTVAVAVAVEAVEAVEQAMDL